MTRGGIFLDRDGTINKEVDFLSSPLGLELLPDSAKAIREAKDLGFKVFIITNQSGVARGLLTERDLEEIHTRLVDVLAAEHAHIDAIYYCPHHPDFGSGEYRKECDCRKPNIGMVTQAAREFDVDPKASFVIGDRMIDIQLGRNIKAKSILVLTGYGRDEQALCRKEGIPIDYVAENLYDAMQYVKRTMRPEHLPIT